MIREICKLHSQLDFDKQILIKFNRFEHETAIQKADILKIEGTDDDVLKVIKPNGEIRLINSNHIIMAYFTRRTLL